MKKDIQIGFNTRLVYNEHDQMDGDCKGWYLVIDNENMRPMLKAIAPKRGANTAIPGYAFFLGEKVKAEIVRALSSLSPQKKGE